ncbi:hypothetical protein SARC_05997 [Sphaeroforma arctica JP610]|uniref:Uncharacterized protein n=1 Tax=Sphaeroforma arctica JP610 TaxID=667725 RepID=A0A0L0FXZ1_9EUKA|nr:hypothetical protein SARC_05997 [Sphaeroforma arctica JP610]KNC81687.1 hypothetical protein SARC_05997 [Sphaeroforma arctica JP610]|eukprot:XP_014155589.1 hypothetical protein SARC_05997 [Sphaeroforma arctica JP610]
MTSNRAYPSFELPPVAVVSIDLGTAYSGIGYSLAGSNGDQIFCSAPSEELRSKTSTILVLDYQDNFIAFGREAEVQYKTYLEKVTLEYQEVDDAGQSVPSTPLALYKLFKLGLYDIQPGESPLVLSEDGERSVPLTLALTLSLKALKDFAVGHIRNETTLNIHVHEIRWVITVPAIWSQTAKNIMRECAVSAGLIPNHMSTRLVLALEPEAAAIAIGKNMTGLLAKGAKCMVIDLGGGTADICNYIVTNQSPLKMQELIAPTGGQWGGSSIDSAFEAFLRDFLGPSNLELFQKQYPLDYFTLIEQFISLKEDTVKRYISMAVLFTCPELDLDLKEVVESFNSKHYETPVVPHGATRIELSEPLIEMMYQDTTKNIINHLKNLLQKPELAGMNYFLMAGGFSCSRYIQTKLQAVFGNRVHFAIPPKPRQAVMIGAVLFGMQPNATVEARISPVHYGVKCSTTHRSAYPAHVAVYDSILRQYVVHDTFSVGVSKNEKIPAGYSVTKSYTPLYPHQATIQFEVYSCALENVPSFVTNQHVKRISTFTVNCDANKSQAENETLVTYNFGSTEITVSALNSVTREEVEVKMALQK